MIKTFRLCTFILALLLHSACGGHAPARDAGSDDDDDVTRSEAGPEREAGADDEDAGAASSDPGAPSDGAVASDAGMPGDAAREDGAAPFQIAAAGRSRITVANRKICAISEEGDAVCWGADGASARREGVALHGSFHSVKRCRSSGPAAVCAIAEDRTLTCAGWDGGPSGFFHNPQECRPPITAAAFSCGGLWEIAVLDPQGAISRLTDFCDLFAEGRMAGPHDRVEMVDDNFCALDRAQKMHCFPRAQLPDGGVAPEEPVIDDAYVDLALDEITTCGVTREGRVRCWDYLGVELTAKDDFAATASSRGKVARLAADPEGSGDTLCALFEDGSVGCSFSFARAAIRMLQKDKPWVEIAVDGETLCGVRSDRSVECRPSNGGSCIDAECLALAKAIVPPQGLRVPE